MINDLSEPYLALRTCFSIVKKYKSFIVEIVIFGQKIWEFCIEMLVILKRGQNRRFFQLTSEAQKSKSIHRVI